MLRRHTWVTAALLAAAFFLAAAGVGTLRSADPPAAAAVDLYGDPLPPGAVARLGTVRFRLASRFGVYGTGFLADNQTVVTVGLLEAQLWDATTGRLQRELRLQPLQVAGFAMAPDRKRF